MSLGQGSLGIETRKQNGGGASVTGANNGTSLSGSTVQLGQDVGAVGDPAALLSNREIPLEGFSFNFKGLLIDVLIDDVNEIFQVADAANNQFVFADPQNDTWWFGDIPAAYSETYMYMDSTGIEFKAGHTQVIFVDKTAKKAIFGFPTGFNNGLHLHISDTTNAFIIDNAAHNAHIELNGVSGISGTFAPVNSITVVGGIVTAVA